MEDDSWVRFSSTSESNLVNSIDPTSICRALIFFRVHNTHKHLCVSHTFKRNSRINPGFEGQKSKKMNFRIPGGVPVEKVLNAFTKHCNQFYERKRPVRFILRSRKEFMMKQYRHKRDWRNFIMLQEYLMENNHPLIGSPGHNPRGQLPW
jgi:hypothetical protein